MCPLRPTGWALDRKGRQHHGRRHTGGGPTADQGCTALAVPKGPRGERRPADVVGCAVRVAKIATGEIEETAYRQPAKRKGGLAGAKARAEKLTKEERSQIGRIAAQRRWSD